MAVKICKGLGLKISEGTPKFLRDLIIKCWDAKIENRPTAKELSQILKKWHNEYFYKHGEIYSQMEEYDTKFEKNRRENTLGENKSKNIKTHPQAIYTSRLLNFKNLPEPINSSDLSFQFNSEGKYLF